MRKGRKNPNKVRGQGHERDSAIKLFFSNKENFAELRIKEITKNGTIDF